MSLKLKILKVRNMASCKDMSINILMCGGELLETDFAKDFRFHKRFQVMVDPSRLTPRVKV